MQFSTTLALVCCPPPPCRLSSEPRPRTPGILNTVSIHPPSESRPLTSDMSPLCLEFKPLKLWPSEENPSIRSRGEVYPTWTPYSPHVNDTKTHAMYLIVLSCTASLVICHNAHPCSSPTLRQQLPPPPASNQCISVNKVRFTDPETIIERESTKYWYSLLEKCAWNHDKVADIFRRPLI